VLSLLQDEFPDVTISKIRFLESQGLLDPERTPSGYRKFYERDIERLRWILTQQKENFLPLKVIKDRLAEADASGAALPPPEPELVPHVSEAPPRAERPTMTTVTASVLDSADAPTGNPLDAGPTEVSLTLPELAEAAGLSVTQVRELERYGLLEGRALGDEFYYDGDALVVARAAAGFLRFGIEARHLRMYKVAAEREAGFFEQVITPLLKQRNPAARREAAGALGDLARLGDSMRGALLRGALRGHTES
jgi:DNA-binding transcriptional MerR regulator